jgi:multisubunit Na+/H+ antiporter MnhC subunit
MGSIALMAFAAPYYLLLHAGHLAAVVLAVVCSLAIGHAMLYSVQASLIPELFGTRVRYTGASLGYQLAAPLAGGTAPMIAAGLVQEFKHQWWPLPAYIILTCVVSLACLYFLAETSRKDLAAEK